MKRTWLGILATTLALAAFPARGQGSDLSKVEIKPTKIAGSVWLLEGAGGNIGVSSGTDGVLMVDDQFLPLAEKIKAALSGISKDGKLAFVVNTHWHGDHRGGNRAFGKDATIVAQTNVRKRLQTPQGRGGRMSEAAPREALPVVTFDDGVTIWFKGSNVVHMGDQFFNGMFPFIDVSSGGDLTGYVKNVADMVARIPADAKIIPGHGALGTLDDLKKFHTMLAKTTDIVRQDIAKGMTVEEAKKAGLPDEWKSWASDFITVDTWIETVYTNLKK